jgi:multidrug efflux system membrane fusion protein
MSATWYKSFPQANLAFLLAISLLAVACGEKKPVAAPPVPVMVATAVETTVPVEIRNIGSVDPYATVGIKSRLAGQLVQVNFQEGQDVKAGDLLFVIDPRPYEGALKQAEANLEKDKALAGKAQSDLKRYAELIKKQFVSQQDYDQAKATAESLGAVVHADEVAVQNARLNLSYCYIKAPISGRTGSLLANQGNMIKDNADTPMVVINQIQPIYVTFSVPEKNLPTLKQFMAQGKVRVNAIIPADPEQHEEGVLTFINNTVDQTTGTIQSKATFDNLGKRLWPGLFVNVVVKLTEEPNVILVPSQAIQTGQQGQFVWVVNPDLSAEPRSVEVARSINSDVIVKKGLKPGDKVVTEGQLRLVKGAKVEIKSKL